MGIHFLRSADRKLDAEVHAFVTGKPLACTHAKVERVGASPSLVACVACGQRFGSTGYAMARAWPHYSGEPNHFDAVLDKLRRKRLGSRYVKELQKLLTEAGAKVDTFALLIAPLEMCCKAALAASQSRQPTRP